VVVPTALMLSRGAAPHSSGATRSVARNEARKRRANERRYVGSCNELARFYRERWMTWRFADLMLRDADL